MWVSRRLRALCPGTCLASGHRVRRAPVSVRLLFVAASVCGCAGGTPAGSGDPFAAGKADGADLFDPGAVVSVRLTGDRDEATLVVETPDDRVRYDDVEVSTWAEVAAGEVLRVRLDRDDSLAGLRSFLLHPVAGDEVDRMLAFPRLLEHVGAPAPRAAGVAVSGIVAGPHLLVEHVGDRFAREHFGFDEGERVRSSEHEALAVVRDRLSDHHGAGGPRAVASVIDVDVAARLVAAAHALELDPPITLVDACEDEDQTCWAPVPEVGADALPLSTLAGAVLRHSRSRALYAAALADAAACLADDACAPDAQRAERALRRVELERGFDAPDGAADYAAFTADGDGVLVARFRNLSPGVHAAAVTMRIEEGGVSRDVELSHDPDADLWAAELDAPPGPFTREYLVVDADGRVHRVEDPTASDPSAPVDPTAIDVLFELHRVDIDVREPSGLAHHRGRLLVVGDAGQKLIEIDPETGERVGTVSLGRRGLEGVEIDPLTEEIVVADEEAGAVMRYDPDGERLARHDFGWADDGNGGIEGLTIRPSDGHLLFAKERAPTRIAEATPDGRLVERRRVTFADDLSALAWGDDGFLYALSDEDRTLFRLDAAWDVLASWEIDVDKPEGLAVAGGLVYVVSDEDDELVVFELNRR